MIKMLLADDHNIVRDGFRRIVEDAGDMQVFSEAADGKEAIEQVKESVPGVAVIDISMPGYGRPGIYQSASFFVF